MIYYKTESYDVITRYQCVYKLCYYYFIVCQNHNYMSIIYTYKLLYELICFSDYLPI